MPINKKSRVNRVITWLHLWLGLISGIVVVIVSLTGCLFAFQTEISSLIRHKEFFIAAPPPSTPTLPLHVLAARAQEALGAAGPANYFTLYADPGRAWEFLAYEEGHPEALSFAGSVNHYESVFVDPYTGRITGHIDYLRDFFVIVKYLHWSLLLNTRYGQPVVGWSTLLFVVSLITGFIMWFPAKWNETERSKSFNIRWKAAWKRLNYDLHNVLGFYTLVIALLLALTGLVYAFPWFSSAVYAAGAMSTEPPPQALFASDTSAAAQAQPIDRAFAATVAAFPRAKRYGITVPQGPADPIAVTAYAGREVYYDQTTLYFDRYTGQRLGGKGFGDMNNGEKLLAMNYDIHVGAIGGLPGKILAFLVSLVCASLPVTGFIIWWGKKKKKTPPRSAVRRRRRAAPLPS